MKKIIIILFIITLFSLMLNSNNQVIIPNTAIRFRIIANSNTKEDQSLKYQIKNEIEPTIIKTLTGSQTLDDARKNIQESIPEFKSAIEKLTTNYNINYGNNYFPEKEYKGVIYPEGEYESLVVTLGNGLGENWWCILFPPLCLLEAEETEVEETEYKFYIQELIEKYMN